MLKVFRGLIIGSAVLNLTSCADFFNSKKPSLAPTQTVPPASQEGNLQKPSIQIKTISPENTVKSLGYRVYLPAIEDFTSELVVLKKRIGQAQQDQRYMARAREQVEMTLLAWHFMEAVSFGRSFNQIQPQSFYSWPAVNTCGIDRAVVALKKGDYRPSSIVSVKGLGAIEYLLLETAMGESSCAANNPTAAPVREWYASLSQTEKTQDRLNLAAVLMEQTLEQWQQINLPSRVVAELSQSAPSFNQAAFGLFHLEVMKDQRVGRPLGFHRECLDTSGFCPGAAEHPWSQSLSWQASVQRVKGFQRLLLGPERVPAGELALGFQQSLQAAGRADVANRLLTQAETVIRQWQQFENTGRSFQEKILATNKQDCIASSPVQRKVELCAAFQDLREITTTLKTDFLVALSLRAPPAFQGDAD